MTTSARDLITEINAIRETRGMEPRKFTGASKQELQEALNKLKAKGGGSRSTVPTSPLWPLCEELGITPKTARAKLRKKGFKAPYKVTDALRAALAG